jgi:thiol-disulfide isomerase/thioredoxin
LSRKPAPAAEVATAPQPRPTWGELIFEKKPIPVDESIKRVSRGKDTTAPGEEIKIGPNAPAAIDPTLLSSTAGSAVFCQFDPAERTLKDFQLPDTQGKMVAFHDLDADLVLIDFWGTWCAPCRKSIPHLNEIQQTLGGKKIQVIGIACERTPAKDRAAKVALSVKELKIQYPVLVTGMDGHCPVQEAFQIQFYPTMVLLDRQGRIVWREQGATDVTLARMDRFILKNLRRSGSTDDSRQARGPGSRDDALRQ